MNDRILEIRTVTGLTQEELGKKLGITKSGVSAIESGLRNVTDKHILLLETNLNVNPVWLRTGIGDMFTPASETAIDQLVAKHHLRPMEKTILEAFVKLPEGYRDGVMEYIKAIVTAVIADGDKQVERENQALHEHPAFNLPNTDEGEEKAHA